MDGTHSITCFSRNARGTLLWRQGLAEGCLASSYRLVTMPRTELSIIRAEASEDCRQLYLDINSLVYQ